MVGNPRISSLFDGFPPWKEEDVFDQSYEEGSYESRDEGFRDNEREKGGEEIFHGAHQPKDRDDDKSLDDAQWEDDSDLEYRVFHVKSVLDQDGQEEHGRFGEGVDAEDTPRKDIHHVAG